MLMVKFELSGEAAYEVVSLEAKYRNMKYAACLGHLSSRRQGNVNGRHRWISKP